MLNSPPHTAHKLQPLGLRFLKSFKSAYNDECVLWMRSNLTVSTTRLPGSALNPDLRMDIAVDRFHHTGIFFLDNNVFSDIDFIASNMYNITER